MIMLCAIDWVAVGSISSAIMALLTLVIIYQNMQARKGVLVIDIEKDDEWIWLTMSNIGETLIDNIKFTFDKGAKELASGVLHYHIDFIEHHEYTLKPSETRKVRLESMHIVNSMWNPDNPHKDDITSCSVINNYFDDLLTRKITIKYKYKTIYRCKKKGQNTFIINPEKIRLTSSHGTR